MLKQTILVLLLMVCTRSLANFEFLWQGNIVTNAPICQASLYQRGVDSGVLDEEFLTSAIERASVHFPEFSDISTRALPRASLAAILNDILNRMEKNPSSLKFEHLLVIFPQVVQALYTRYAPLLASHSQKHGGVLAAYRFLLNSVINDSSATEPREWLSVLDEWQQDRIKKSNQTLRIALRSFLSSSTRYITFSLERASVVLPELYGEKYGDIHTYHLELSALSTMAGELLDELIQRRDFFSRYALIFPEIYQGYLEMAKLKAKTQRSSARVASSELVQYTKILFLTELGIRDHFEGTERARQLIDNPNSTSDGRIQMPDGPATPMPDGRSGYMTSSGARVWPVRPGYDMNGRERTASEKEYLRKHGRYASP